MNKDKILAFIFSSIGIIVITTILLLPIILFINSLPVIEHQGIWKTITCKWIPDEKLYGIAYFLVSSLITATLSTVISFIWGFGLSLYIYHNKKKYFADKLKSIIQYMAGIPTVVYAFIGIIILIPLIREYTSSPTGYSIISMCIALSVLALPTVFFYIYSSFNLVDRNKILTAKSLGANRLQIYFHIIIPGSIKGLTTAFLLGFGRTISDTMIPLMLSGNALNFPNRLLNSARTLTAHIALVFPGEFDGIEFKIIFFISLLLFIISIIINITVNHLEKNEL